MRLPARFGRRGTRTCSIVVSLVAVALAAGLLFRPWVASQARALVVFATVTSTPGLSWVVEQVTGDPRTSDERVGGVPTTVVKPGGKGPWPAIVFVNGATSLGRWNPHVRALARGLARAGYLVLVPELPGLARGELTSETIDATARVASEASTRADVRGGKTALLGVSSGGALALLAAARTELRGRISVIGGMGAYVDVRTVLSLATTGTYASDEGSVPYRTKPFLALAGARSLVAALPEGRDRSDLRSELAGVAANARDPLAVLRAPRERLGRPARAVVALLANRNPDRFDELYARLPEQVRAACRRLSPLAFATRLRAPVILAAGDRDTYFPAADTARLAAGAPAGVVTRVRTISHTPPNGFPGGLRELLLLDAFFVRVLRLVSA
jgi:dienelactone hydrolase